MSTENLYTDVSSSIIHNCKKVETNAELELTAENNMHMIEYYSTIKRNEAWMHATTWMNLRNIMLNGKARHKGHIF